MDSPSKMKSHNRPSSSSSHAASPEHLANVDPNLPKTSLSFSSKSSFKHELGTSSSCRAGPASPRATDSLATHIGGATFASIARAAELQAARGRQELNAQPSHATGRASSPYLITAESMPRRGRVWKKFDLSETSDTNTASSAGKENIPLATIVSNLVDKESIASNDPSGAERAASSSQKAESIAPEEQNAPTPESGAMLPSQLSELVSQSTSPSPWELPTPDANAKHDVIGVANEAAVINVALPHSNMPRADPILPARDPIAAGIFDAMTHKKQHFSSTESSRLPGYPRMDSFVSNPDDFRVHAEEALRSTYPFVNRSGTGTFYDAPSSSNTMQLKAKPPHYYPAVKGTKADLERNSAANFNNDVGGRITPHSSGTFCETSKKASHLDDIGPPPAFESRFTREESQSAADRAISNAEWNLRGISKQQSPLDATANHDSKLAGASENDSWKSRQAPVVNAAGQSVQDDHPVVFNMRMTPHGVFPVHDQPSVPLPAPAVQRQRPGKGWYDLLTDTYRTDGRGKPVEQQYPSNKVYSTLFARSNPPVESTPTAAALAAVKEEAAELFANAKARQAAERDALREANFADDIPEPKTPDSKADPEEVVAELLVPVLANLSTYRREHPLYEGGCFNRFGPAPSWCIDHGLDGNNSFFGADWGTPPARVGRDPRYRMNGRQGPQGPQSQPDWGATARQVRNDLSAAGRQRPTDWTNSSGALGRVDWNGAGRSSQPDWTAGVSHGAPDWSSGGRRHGRRRR